ncbi:unnamed protein product [Schistocephalus solidus]|uniref:Uncharacterized protein n=1 Tax=Schistocephalus solidus TaxID=70667 RepID=A0A183SWT7_SCHSO|nr:unnamed protein product [Schistocephalus solidus]
MTAVKVQGTDRKSQVSPTHNANIKYSHCQRTSRARIGLVRHLRSWQNRKNSPNVSTNAFAISRYRNLPTTTTSTAGAQTLGVQQSPTATSSAPGKPLRPPLPSTDTEEAPLT